MIPPGVNLADELNQAAIAVDQAVDALIAVLPENKTARRLAKLAKAATGRLLDADMAFQDERIRTVLRPDPESIPDNLWTALDNLEKRHHQSSGLFLLLQGFFHCMANPRRDYRVSEGEADDVESLLAANQEQSDAVLEALFAAYRRRRKANSRTTEDPPEGGGYQAGSKQPKD